MKKTTTIIALLLLNFVPQVSADISKYIFPSIPLLKAELVKTIDGDIRITRIISENIKDETTTSKILCVFGLANDHVFAGHNKKEGNNNLSIYIPDGLNNCVGTFYGPINDNAFECIFVKIKTVDINNTSNTYWLKITLDSTQAKSKLRTITIIGEPIEDKYNKKFNAELIQLPKE